MANKIIRCAIYTRKSTEEGLDQDFNSLDAQREAAEAFIQSQKHAGWTLVLSRYDDGGYSGGSLERPGLQRLLDDIDQRRLDCVVVYKVDRLSRSLLDFARLIDRFDQGTVSFVSVTQQFNTTTSLGRLTLNILLSFAQFEREIISERTRDKMTAARRKGKWVGGTPMLGYDVDPAGGGLTVNEKEARRVREIFELYRTHRSLTKVVAELGNRNWRNKSWKSQGGRVHRGRAFTKNSLRRLLTNATYAGRVEHRGVIYKGEHAPIVEATVWDAVNMELRAGRRERPSVVHHPHKALLGGVLLCQHCAQPMIATYTSKPKRRYRYYVCRAARKNGWSTCPTKSVPARMIEDSVVEQVRAVLANSAARDQLRISEADMAGFEANAFELVRAVVKSVRYDGLTGAVALDLRAKEAIDED
jgi:site-specific DNA recombinase